MAKTNKYGELESDDDRQSSPTDHERFTCKGCGERATAQKGHFCKKCSCFYHTECLKTNKCPLCKELLTGTPSGCFITTAVAEAVGPRFADGSLDALRRLRDTYMQESSDRRAEVELYYRIAPLIVERIQSAEESRAIWRDVAHRFIYPTVRFAAAGNAAEAHRLYRQMVHELTHRWLSVDERDQAMGRVMRKVAPVSQACLGQSLHESAEPPRAHRDPMGR